MFIARIANLAKGGVPMAPPCRTGSFMGREDSTGKGVVMVQGDEDSTRVPLPAWPREARWLHAGIAFGVTWQIWSSL